MHLQSQWLRLDKEPEYEKFCAAGRLLPERVVDNPAESVKQGMRREDGVSFFVFQQKMKD